MSTPDQPSVGVYVATPPSHVTAPCEGDVLLVIVSAPLSSSSTSTSTAAPGVVSPVSSAPEGRTVMVTVCVSSGLVPSATE